LLFGSIYQHFIFLQIATRFTWFRCWQYRCSIPFTAMGTIWRDCDKDVGHYQWKKLELTPLSDRICRLKLVQIEPRSTHQKRGLCWITKWQFYFSMSYVRLSLKIPSQYEKYTWGYTWRPLACYLFINIKLAAYHLLLYVVYFCQKSQNFVYALICYKQKCKVVSLNLAHPVDNSVVVRW